MQAGAPATQEPKARTNPAAYATHVAPDTQEPPNVVPQDPPGTGRCPRSDRRRKAEHAGHAPARTRLPGQAGHERRAETGTAQVDTTQRLGPTGGLSGLQDPCRVGRPGLHVTDVCPVWAGTPGEPQVAACVCLRCLWPAYERRCAGCDQDLEARLGVRSRPARTWRHGRPGKRQQVQADSRVVD